VLLKLLGEVRWIKKAGFTGHTHELHNLVAQLVGYGRDFFALPLESFSYPHVLISLLHENPC
jgi:hypothetical protein